MYQIKDEAERRIVDLSERAQAVFAEEADRLLVLQPQKLLLDLRSQPQQAHDLGDADPRHAHFARQVGLSLDEGVALKDTGVSPGLEQR